MQNARPASPATPETPLSARYVVYREIAAGGMASVQYGRLLGPHGFSRAVAVKRLHPHLAKDPELVAMFLDEARLSARLVHANIVHTLDVIEAPGEVALVMEYVPGESLWHLLHLARARGELVPVRVACSLITSVLHGLHAVHEARAADGASLDIVHRDVSPQNILVGSDGIPRLLDFGIAKARVRTRATRRGEIKGKLSYIAREQLQSQPVDRRTDVYGASVVLWETLTGTRLFDGPSEQAVVHNVLYAQVEPPAAHRADLPPDLDALVLRGLRRDPDERFASAQAMALALERAVDLASQSEVAGWLRGLAGPQLDERERALSALTLTPALAAADPRDANTRRVQPRVLDATQRTSLPVARAEVAERAQPPRRAALLWLGAAALLGAGTLLWRQAGAREPAPTVTEPSAATSGMTTPLALDAGEPAAATCVIEPASAEPAPGAARAAPLAGAAPLKKPVPERAHGRSARAAPGVDDPCVPFYELDAHGIRHPKPECI